jgi:hypothetical protein
VLAVNLFELLDRLLWVLLLVEKVQTLIVEALGWLVGRRIVLAEQAAASAKTKRQQQNRRDARAPRSAQRALCPMGRSALPADRPSTAPV